jgi:hypothetical protein
VRFAGNTYRLDQTRPGFLGPANASYTFTQWQGLGQDKQGRVLPASTVGSLPGEATRFVKSDYGARNNDSQPARR